MYKFPWLGLADSLAICRTGVARWRMARAMMIVPSHVRRSDPGETIVHIPGVPARCSG